MDFKDPGWVATRLEQCYINWNRRTLANCGYAFTAYDERICYQPKPDFESWCSRSQFRFCVIIVVYMLILFEITACKFFVIQQVQTTTK